MLHPHGEAAPQRDTQPNLGGHGRQEGEQVRPELTRRGAAEKYLGERGDKPFSHSHSRPCEDVGGSVNGGVIDNDGGNDNAGSSSISYEPKAELSQPGPFFIECGGRNGDRCSNGFDINNLI
jgi:hypothetical protein